MLFTLAGFASGVVGGLFGIGGAALLVPLLVYVFKFSQQQAQGTSLAVMLPPIGALAALQYYRAGYVEMRPALFIAAGFVFGAFVGAAGAVRISAVALQRGFGIFLIALGLQMVLRR